MSHRGKHGADEKILVALVCGATIEVAARAGGVSPSTVKRRLRTPEFQERQKNMSREFLQRAMGMLLVGALESIKAILAMVQNQATPPGVRLGAARTMLDQNSRYQEMGDIVQRMAILEAKLKLRAENGDSDPPP